MKLFRPVKGEGPARKAQHTGIHQPSTSLSKVAATVPSPQIDSSEDPPKHRRSHSSGAVETAPSTAELSSPSMRFTYGSGRIGQKSRPQQVGSSDEPPQPLPLISPGGIETTPGAAARAAFKISSPTAKCSPQIEFAPPRRRHDPIPDRGHKERRKRRTQSYYNPFDEPEYRPTSPAWETAYPERGPYLVYDREYASGDYLGRSRSRQSEAFYLDDREIYTPASPAWDMAYPALAERSAFLGYDREYDYGRRRGSSSYYLDDRAECKKLRKKLSELERRHQQTLDLIQTPALPEENFSDENAIQLVNGLNDKISSIADEVIRCFGARLSTVVNQISFNSISGISLRPVKVALGTHALTDLLTCNHKLDTSLVRWAIQAYICHHISRISSHWNKGDVTTIYHNMRAKESQAISGKWRSLTCQYTSGRSKEKRLDNCVSICIERIAMLLSLSGVTSYARWEVLVPECNQSLKTPLVALWDAALETSDMFNKEVISSDYGIFNTDSGGGFDAAEMKFQAGASIQVDPELNTLVRYTIALGLKRTRCVDGGGNLHDGKVEERTLLKAVVIRPSDAEAVKNPTQSSELVSIPPLHGLGLATTGPSTAAETPPQNNPSTVIPPSPQRHRRSSLDRGHSRADQDDRISTTAVAGGSSPRPLPTKFGARLSSLATGNHKSDMYERPGQSSPTKKTPGLGAARRKSDGVTSTSTGPRRSLTVRETTSSSKWQTLPRHGAKLPPSGQISPVRPAQEENTKRASRLVEVDKPLPPLEIPEIPDEDVPPIAEIKDMTGAPAVNSAQKERDSETDAKLGESVKPPSNTECNPDSLTAGPTMHGHPMPVERENDAEPTPAPVDAAEAARVQANIMNILMAEIRGW